VLTVCDRVAMERGQLTDDARAAANGERPMAASQRDCRASFSDALTTATLTIVVFTAISS
jgi:hypothetical protein